MSRKSSSVKSDLEKSTFENVAVLPPMLPLSADEIEAGSAKALREWREKQHKSQLQAPKRQAPDQDGAIWKDVMGLGHPTFLAERGQHNRCEIRGF
jgi:hypothetical protein